MSNLESLISSLAPRTFLLHNVHAHSLTPVVFQTRWAMSYLAGPLSREQVRVLVASSELRIANEVSPGTGSISPPSRITPHASRPPLATDIQEHFFPVARALHDAVNDWRTQANRPGAAVDLQAAQLIYRPALFAQAIARYVSAKAGINEDKPFAFLVEDLERSKPVDWREAEAAPVDVTSLEHEPQPGSSFGEAPAGLADPKRLAAWQKSLADYLYRTGGLIVLNNPTLKLYSRPGDSLREFRQAGEAAARARRDVEVEKLRAQYDKKIDALEARLAKETDELDADRAEHDARRAEQRWVDIENVVGFAIGRSPYRALSTSTRARRLADKAKDEVAESEESIKQLEAQIAALKAEAQTAFQSVNDKWAAALNDVQETRITPKKSDILFEAFGVAWLPYWQAEADGLKVEIPAHR